MSSESRTRFTVIYAPELFERLRWFAQLRWLAVAGLGFGAIISPLLGLSEARSALLLVAIFVAVYNLFFQWRLRAATDYLYENLRSCAIRQMVMDLLALGITVHFTGGLESPLQVFFVFHMAIGTVMIRTSIMYILAASTGLGIFMLYLAEGWGVLAHHAITGSTAGGLDRQLNMWALLLALFMVVYLTDSVMSSFKRHSIKLFDTSAALSERSEELTRLLAEMRELEQRKSHYMKISAHQLRSPLGTIRSSLDVLTSGFVDPSSERGKRLLAGATERVDGLLTIVSALLELTKVREGQAKAPWAQGVSLAQVVTDVVDEMGLHAESRSIRILSEVDPSLVLEWAVPPDLVHAIGNLVHNAIIYSKEGGEVTVIAERRGEQAMICVRDEGIGIPEDFIDQVFHEFVRTPAGRKQVVDGTGLGLTIVREVVEAHGGTVSVRSVEGEGSEFCALLPLGWAPAEHLQSLQGGNE